MSLFDSAQSIKFTNPGDTAEGTILSMSEEQQKEFDRTTGKPSDKLATWDDGSPKYQLVFQLDTDRRDDDTDSGQRAVYVSSTRAIKAVVNAVRSTGSRTPEQGGYLRLTYTGNDPKSFNGSAKAFTAEYRKPQQATQTFGGQQPSHPQQASTQQAASSSQAADPWSDPLTSEQRTKLQQLDAIGGLPDATVAQAVGVDVATLHAARGDEVI